MARKLEHQQIYKNCTIMIYNDNGTRSYCWGNMCWKSITDVKNEIDKTVKEHNNWLVTVKP